MNNTTFISRGLFSCIPHSQKRKQAGQSLFEVVIALLVVGITAVGIVKISSTSIRNARYANEQTGAVALGEKKLVELRAYAINQSDEFWGKVPYSINELSGMYCWFADISYGALPTETTPRYSEGKLADIKMYVFWDIKGNSSCSTLDLGLEDYNKHLEFSTFVTK